MSTANLLRLILLAAIWGSSFLFMRIAAPVLGPAVLIEYRVAFAALFLCIVGFFLKKKLNLKTHWKHYLILGFFNSALPFLLFAMGARVLTAAVLVVLNATAPMWGALITAVWYKQKISARVAIGLVLGTVGVSLLVGFDHVNTKPGAMWAVAGGLAAAFSYSVASAYTKSATAVEPFANAHGSMWAATLVTIPALALFPQPAEATMGIMGAALALGVMCTGIAYLIYFKLIADVGATSALTVTFLNPIFGIMWGAIFLDEIIGWYTILGCATVIVGTAMVTGYKPKFMQK
jgi:drug/metabolite transporter (DMT)-like permease